MAQASANISKKRKHVAEGVFKAELDGYLRKVSSLLQFEKLCFSTNQLGVLSFMKGYFYSSYYIRNLPKTVTPVSKSELPQREPKLSFWPPVLKTFSEKKPREFEN